MIWNGVEVKRDTRFIIDTLLIDDVHAQMSQTLGSNWEVLTYSTLRMEIQGQSVNR